MGLKPWTMSFKETNSDEVKLHELLALKTSPMAFAKDVLIDILIRSNKSNGVGIDIKERLSDNQSRGEIEDIFDI